MRKVWMTKWAITASLTLLCSTLAACSSGNGSTPAVTKEPTSLDVSEKQILKVSVFTEDRFLEEAVNKFEQAYPNIDVQIQETVPTEPIANMESQMYDIVPAAEDIEKYVNSVNTALMSGNAADLISVGYLPVDRYLDKGLLSDWSKLADQDGEFQTADYYERVLKGISDTNNGWYAIPISYSLKVMLGNKAAIAQGGEIDDETWTWEQFMALSQKFASQAQASGTKTSVFGGMKPEELLGYLTETIYEKLVLKEGTSRTFDEEAFRVYMEQIKELYDSGAASKDHLGIMNQVFSTMDILDPLAIATLPSTLGNGIAEVLTPPGTGTDEGLPFTSDLAFALNKQSKVKPAAWEFVKFLLSEEIQSSPSLTVLPVHQAAVKTRVEQITERLNSGEASVVLTDKNGAAQSLSATDEQINDGLNLLPSVGNYEHKDDKVIAMIKEETASFFSGSKSAEAVAAAVASKVNTYLNE
ncbi:hypothetical protein BK126_18515 [Paenibacillus sp. FSL H7-0326]|uniref:ABC transporter substrate-binding protein n=1 Tax=Paenibacillus sp. FSL H7-0326 TaxID=1921144 RepID=UPI00096C7A6B|nr:ABC transporter substrate-binding protein [Paenibacillus sp. FSL H7-0326]OMC67565.1 hypothetical protein BK126_18515 [Paenibacillus sp. FSL H7-0326]